MEPLACKLGRWGLLCLALSFSVAPALRADVTVRYQTGMNSAALPPPGMDLSSTVHIKGNKVSTTTGGITMIIDAVKQEITLIDAAHKALATIPASQYAKKVTVALPEMPADASETVQGMLAKTKTKVESRITGRTEAIQGIQAVEREITASLEMPMPEGMPIPSMGIKMIVRTWTAKPEEVLRVPALRELAALNLWQKYFMDPGGSFLQFGQMAGGGMASLAEEMYQDRGVILRVSMEMSMPSMDALAGEQRSVATGPESSPQPLFQTSMELVELSSAPLEDSLFRIPSEYAPTDFDDLMKGAVQDLTRAASASPEKPALARHDGAKAYVPSLSPIKEVDPVYPPEARDQGVTGNVELLATLDPQGNVTNAEALTGPQILRQPAIDAVKQWKFRPVLRNGQPVIALTNPTVFFSDPENRGKPLRLSVPNFEEERAANDRLTELANEMPRSAQQVLADREQDVGGRDAIRRFYALNSLAKAALDAGAAEKAAAYANELLAAAAQHPEDWNYGNAVHDGHTTLGLLAIRQGEVDKASQHLLESAPIAGSPQLNSFGPSMSLAKELLDKGERGAVLQYFSLCRTFWKMGAQSLDAWSEAVRNGKTPNFGISMR
jgi:TonB family protein